MSRDIGRSNPRAAGHVSVSIRSRDAASMADKTLSVREGYWCLRLLTHRRHQLISPKALHDVGASA
jgi:hypothetical protein